MYVYTVETIMVECQHVSTAKQYRKLISLPTTDSEGCNHHKNPKMNMHKRDLVVIVCMNYVDIKAKGKHINQYYTLD